MTNLLERVEPHTTHVAVSTYAAGATSHLGSLRAKNNRLQLGSFSKAVLSLMMRQDGDFTAATVDTLDTGTEPVNELLCHHRRSRALSSTVYSYDDSRFRLALDLYLRRRNLAVSDLPGLIKATLGMRVAIADPSRPERSLTTTHFDLHHMLKSARAALHAHPPKSDPTAVFHLGSSISTPLLQTGSPFFWSKDPVLVLQHGGIVGRTAVLMLLAPDDDRGFVISLEADDAPAAQVAVAEAVCDELSIPLAPACADALRAALPCGDDVDGWYVDGAHRLRVRTEHEHLVLEQSGAPDRLCRRLDSEAFVDLDDMTPRRYAHTFFAKPGSDGRAIGMVLDQRSYIRCRAADEVFA